MMGVSVWPYRSWRVIIIQKDEGLIEEPVSVEDQAILRMG